MKRQTAGFTLIELLIVISIIGILSVTGLATYINFSRNQLVSQAARKIAQDLRLAQSLASNNQKHPNCQATPLTGYTFYLNGTNYVIKANCGSDYQVKADFVSSNLIVSGPDWIKFKVLRQGLVTSLPTNDLVTTITVFGFGKSKLIDINAGGAINIRGEEEVR
ncbi:MAG TPA: type II secretion system protein [Patescibacteria group bacterium]|nr:type II secretion system protein [Patescibacteria group bacterium]